MDSELNNGSEGNDTGGGAETPRPLKSYGEVFAELAPYYMSIGMTPAEYWDGDNDLPRDYRKADEYRRERESFNAWLQGIYVYEAMIRVAPVFKFGVKNPQPKPYFEEPIPVTTEKANKKREASEKREMEKGLAKMMNLAEKVNQRFEGVKDA